ncbi:MAG: polysaccharide deacetylase [Lentisphaerae bacterium]|nr:polysaccharide deacetylase [Lentisphaerota bacterium]
MNLRPCRARPLGFLAAVLLAVGASSARTPLPNPGFEDGAAGWRVEDSMSVVTQAAARGGGLGLRVVDGSATEGSSVRSARLPVTEGGRVSLSFRARTRDRFMGVYLWFFSPEGRPVKDPAVKDGWGTAGRAIDRPDGGWHDYAMTSAVPPGAASVAVWIHSYSSATGAADCDDFVLDGLDPAAAPLPEKPPAPRPAPVAALPANLPPRARPPAIVLKFDDVAQVGGRAPDAWVRLAGVLRDRGIKAGFGVVCRTLEEAAPEYVKWIRDLHGSGGVEFWFHGWDHATHEADGRKFNEFCGRPFEEQKRRFDRSQELAVAKLGFSFTTFGPPGGVYGPSFDAGTARVMAADPHMRAWLYPQPADAASRALDAEGKVTVLDRVWDVNLERSVGVPDAAWFRAGYARHPDRTYFVLQGHPMMWGAGDRFAQFLAILDFLASEKAEFLLPSDLAARLRSASAGGGG